MRDVFNPIFFLVVAGLFAWDTCLPDSGGGVVGVGAMALCCVAFLVNAGVGAARLLTRRPAMSVTLWSFLYLLVGACTWGTMSPLSDGRLREEDERYRALKKAWEEEGRDPFRHQEDELSLSVLAAALNKTAVLERLLALPEARQQSASLSEAAHAAAERGAAQALELLLKHGVGVDDAWDGDTLLCSAVLGNQLSCAACLLRWGADVNKADAVGTSPLIHAVVNENQAMVRLLMEAGADPRSANEEGRDARSFVRSEEMDRLLTEGGKP